jgi:tetratricopeptide (TPR) repeat protein
MLAEKSFIAAMLTACALLSMTLSPYVIWFGTIASSLFSPNIATTKEMVHTILMRPTFAQEDGEDEEDDDTDGEEGPDEGEVECPEGYERHEIDGTVSCEQTDPFIPPSQTDNQELTCPEDQVIENDVCIEPSPPQDDEGTSSQQGPQNGGEETQPLVPQQQPPEQPSPEAQPEQPEEDIYLLYSRAYEAYEQGMYEQALQDYDRALAIEPNNVYALSNKGLALYNLGNYQEAINQYDRALAIEPNNVEVLNNKGLALYRLERYDEAIVSFNRLLETEPNNVYALSNTGVVLDESGRYPEATGYFDRALAIEPNNVYALSNKGLALYNLGNYQEAINQYDRALAIGPNNVYALNNKAAGLYSLARYDEAMQNIDKVLQIDPTNLYALTNKGLILSQFGRYQEAMQYYDRALNINANYTLALLNRGAALGELGRYEEAIVDFDKALALESATIAEDVTQTSSINREGHQVTWITNSNLGDGDAAKLHYITVFLTSKTAIDAQVNKGIAFFQGERYEQAIEIFDSILLNDDRHIDSLYYTAQCYEKLGDIEQANQYMNMVYQIDPNYQGGGFAQIVATIPLLREMVASLQQLASATAG